ncbi:hypothetical protein M9Y10_021203 [Tritrichomonas musculus]|uniref:Dynein heavy chain family protein n=1 Tax=Tritrichomonas musculus TaxID=1915356 RepID=A0ABR2HF94_9EUKA
MSNDENSLQNNRARELRSRLLPRQLIHSRPLTINTTVAIKRPLTRQLNSRNPREKEFDRKQKSPVSTLLRPPLTPLPTKNITESNPVQDLESITDPFEFIEYIKKNNLTNEFAYLYPRNIIEDAEHPTRLVIIPASKASRQEFWNLSLKGLTHVKGSAVDFIPLDEWLTSLKQFQKLMKIPFFKFQRQWRLFRLWKSYVNRDKIKTAQTALTNDLFYAHFILRPAFIEIQRELYKLNQIKLFSVRHDRLYTLEQFTEDNSKHHDEIAQLFDDFFLKLEKIVQDACEKTIESLNTPEQNNKGKPTTPSPQQSSAPNASPLDLLIDHYNKTQHNYTNAFILDNSPTSLQFTQKAAHRAACAKIVRFIRLVDYVVIGALRNICFNSLLDLFGILESLHNRGLQRYKFTPKKPIGELMIPIEYSRMYSFLLQKATDIFDSPIFKVDVSYDEKLIWKPASDDVITRIGAIRNDYIDILFKVPRLIADPLFRPYITVDLKIDQFSVDKMSTPDLGQIIFNDIVYKETVKKQNDMIHQGYKLLKFFSSAFNKAIEIFEANQRFDISFLDSDRVTANDVREIIKELNEQEAFLNTILDKSEVGIFCCFMKAMKEKFVHSPKICLNKIKSQIPSVTKRFLEKYAEDINKANSELTEPIKDVSSFVSFIHSCEEHNNFSKELQRECDVIRDFYILANEQNILISQDEQFDYSALLPVHDDIKDALAASQGKIGSLMLKFIKILEESINKLHADTEEVTKIANDPKLSDPKTSIQEAANILVVLIARTDEIHELAKNYNNYQNVMNLQKTKFDDVNALVKDVKIKQLMWETKTLWQNETKEWFSANFNLIDPNLLIDKVGEYKNNATIAAKELPENPAADDLCATITDFSNLLPVVEDLKNPALQQTHIDQIELLLGSKIFGTGFTFRQLFDLHAFNYVDHIHMISTQASNEQKLNDMILKVKTDVEALQFTTSIFKGLKSSFILEGIDEISSVLENSMTTISSVRSSHYVSQLRKESDEWIRSLRQFKRCLEVLTECQNKLSFLINIITNSDITRSLSDELKEMNFVEKVWRNISSKVNDDPSAFNICTQNQTLVDLESANDIIEKILRSIEKYLESRRMGFPRLYFLSNRELMELISQSKDPTAIIPFLPRLFDGIYNVEFKSENHIPTITSIMNMQGEKIDVRPIKYRSSIENWLSSIEEVMQRGLRKEIKNSLQTYKEMVYEDWVAATNSQSTFVISQIEFFERVNLAFTSNDLYKSLTILLNEIEMNISTKSRLAQLNLSFIDRTKTQSLLSLDVLHRDILNHLFSNYSLTKSSKEWKIQLKYRWDDENKDILIQQENSVFHYGFEFLACHQRIVITMVTIPIFISLTNALYMKYGGSCYGPYGSGKTETIKELSKSFAVYCVNFNCSETIMAHQLSAMLRGIVQSGTWIILSDFCRVKPEVLSIIGEDFNSIRSASLANLKKFDMDGYEIQLNQQCGIFMTSSYEKFEQLPDSTRVYFRPVAMKTINYVAIIEIQLMSQGFSETHKYALKLASFIRACRDQFIHNNNYCFGMNTVTSILSIIMALKHSESQMSDDQIIVSAIKNVCLKTIDRNDIYHFKEILSSYFIDTKEEYVADPNFVQSLTETCSVLGFQLSPYLIERAEQFHESLGMYMGVIIVGETCVGKSTLIEMLEQTYYALSEVNELYFPIDKSLICPKTMTNSELWGYYNTDSNSWKEGIIEKVFSETQKVQHREQWIIFDGNIDPSWVENMNSALDETRTLTFDSLRRFKLNSQHHILFETADLSQASPSTISRCGVIHIDAPLLPWREFINSKIEQQIEPLFKDHPNLFSKFNEFIDSSLQSAFEYIKENVRQSIPIPLFGLFESFLNLFVVLCSSPEFQASYSAVAMSAIFAFSLAWGFGGYLDTSQRTNFDSFLRDTFSGQMTLPGRGLIYDWSIDLENGQWKNWSECVPSFFDTADDEFEIDPKNLKFYNVVVPTPETVRLTYIIKKMLLAKKNVIIRGPIGSGRRLLSRSILRDLMESDNCLYHTLQFSASTSSDRIHKFFSTMYEVQHSNRVLQPPGGKSSVLYVQDINTPFPDETNSIRSIELLCQLIALKGYRPLPNMEWLDVRNIALLAVGIPDRGLGSSLPSRLSRHCLNIKVPAPDSSTSFFIMNSIWQLYFRTYDDSVKSLIPKLAHVSIQVYESFQQLFPARRDKPFYFISLHDLMRLTESLLSARPKTIRNGQQLERLWYHEVVRTFSDRFENSEDVKKFDEMLMTIFKKLGSNQNATKLTTTLFGSFKSDEKGDKNYSEFENISKIIKTFDDVQNNSVNSRRNGNDKVTLFEHYAKHVARIARIFEKKRGHMLLVGKPGTGKKTIIRFAGLISECEIAEFDYSFNFREELKSLILRCGVNGKEIALVINHFQLDQPGVIDIINCIINSIDMTSFFSTEEIDKICTELVVYAKSSGENESHENLLRLFFERATAHLHVIVCLPSDFRYLQRFFSIYPSFMAMLHIDYCEEWPKSAFLQFANEKFKSNLKQIDDFGTEKESSLSHEEEDEEEEEEEEEEGGGNGGDKITNHKLVDTFTNLSFIVYEKVKEMTVKMKEELQMNYCVTPALFMKFVDLFIKNIKEHKKRYRDKMVRLLIGTDKLMKIEKLAKQLEIQLRDHEENLKERVHKDEILNDTIKKKQNDSESLINKIKNDQLESEKQQNANDSISKNHEAEFALVKPQLNHATQAMKKLKNEDLDEIKGLVEPPLPVKIVMEIICLLLSFEPNWKSAVMILSDPMFISNITTKFDEKSHVPVSVLNKIIDTMNDINFEKASSGDYSFAAQTICQWERALINYETVYRRVEPEQDQLMKASSTMQIARNKLKANQDKAKDIEEFLDTLKVEKDHTEREVRNLTDMVNDARSKMNRYHRLQESLQSDFDKWNEDINTLKNSSQFILGDTFLNTMYFIYLGPFTSTYRNEIVSQIKDECQKNKVLISPNYSFVNSMTDQSTIDKWIQFGLNDEITSLENAILIVESTKSPYIIDPYTYTTKWLKNIDFSDSQLVVMKPNSPNLHRSLEQYAKTGIPVLLEDVGERVDPALESLLTKKTFDQDDKHLIKINDRTVEFDDKFKLFLTTKLHSPQLLPQVFINTTVVMSIPTKEMLEKTELNSIFAAEYPELEEEREKVQQMLTADKRSLIQNQNRLIELLRKNEAAILDADIVVDAITSTKKASDELKEHIENLTVKINEFNTKRDKLSPVTERVGLLFDIAHSLSHISCIYSYSFEIFRNTSQRSVLNAPRDDPLKFESEEKMAEKRINDLKKAVTFDLFTSISESLFQKHRLLFAFIVACKVMLIEKRLPESQFRMFMYGTEIVESPFENPLPDHITNAQWNELHSIAKQIPSMKTLTNQIIAATDEFKKFVESNDNELPSEIFSSLSEFERILIIKIVIPQRVSFFVRNFIISTIGGEYIQCPTFTLESAYQLTKPRVPLIFFLNKNTNPRKGVELLSKSHEINGKVVSLSFGSNASLNIDNLMHLAVTRGDWLFIQNIHLSESLCRDLDVAVSSISKNTAHHDFRLFLTTEVTDKIPISLIRLSVKKSMEQPFSIKGNMLALTNLLDDQIYGQNEKTHLAFQITFLHSLLNVRSKYGAYGFHQHYYFPLSALEMTLKLVELNPSLNFSHWILSKITYGAAIFDTWDKRCFDTFVSTIITERCLSRGEAIIPSSSSYVTPNDETKEEWLKAVISMPDEDSPEIFGLSQNCESMLIQNDSNDFITFMNILTQKVTQAPSIESLIQLVHDTIQKVPSIERGQFDEDDLYFPSNTDPLDCVLASEVRFYRRLIAIMNETLRIMELQLTMKIMITPDVNMALFELLANKVPKKWRLMPGQSKLNNWISELSKKVDFFNTWIERGKPSCFNLSCFSNPRAFLYSLHLRYIKVNKNVPIEDLTFLVSFEEKMPVENDDKNGVIINGFLCNEMQFDKVKGELVKGGKNSLTECPPLRFKTMPKAQLLAAEEEKNVEGQKEGEIQGENVNEEKSEKDDGNDARKEKISQFQCPIYRIMSLNQCFNENDNLVTVINLPYAGDVQELVIDGAALYLANDK